MTFPESICLRQYSDSLIPAKQALLFMLFFSDAVHLNFMIYLLFSLSIINQDLLFKPLNKISKNGVIIAVCGHKLTSCNIESLRVH